MRVAVPTFRDQVSPRFDCATRALLATVGPDKSVRTEVLLLGDGSPNENVRRLEMAGVDTVICGNIDRLSEELLRARGIQVIQWVSGDALVALRWFLDGRLEPGLIIGPGGRCRQWRFGQGGRGGGQGRGRGRWGRGKFN